MAEDVIDIRKRIEEIRNEVSTAMSEGGETVIQSRPAGDVAEFLSLIHISEPTRPY